MFQQIKKLLYCISARSTHSISPSLFGNWLRWEILWSHPWAYKGRMVCGTRHSWFTIPKCTLPKSSFHGYNFRLIDLLNSKYTLCIMIFLYSFPTCWMDREGSLKLGPSWSTYVAPGNQSCLARRKRSRPRSIWLTTSCMILCTADLFLSYIITL